MNYDVHSSIYSFSSYAHIKTQSIELKKSQAEDLWKESTLINDQNPAFDPENPDKDKSVVIRAGLKKMDTNFQLKKYDS